MDLFEHYFTTTTDFIENTVREIIFRGISSIFNVILDFLKKRIRQYQEKKLNEILSKKQFHQYMKKQLEQKIEGKVNDEKIKIIQEIDYQNKMINIWQKNEEKLKKQMSEMEN